MITRTIKNALYAEILEASSDLLESEEAEMKKELENARFDEEEAYINSRHKNSIAGYQRIRNNAAVMLIKNGMVFYTKLEGWKSAKEVFIKINDRVYSISLQVIKTILSNETDKYMDKAFSAKEVNNFIDLSVIQPTDINKKAGNGIERVQEKETLVQPDKAKDRHGTNEPAPDKREMLTIDKKEKEPVKNKENSTRNPQKENPHKEQKGPQDNLNKKKPNKKGNPKDNVKPQVPVIDIDEIFMDDEPNIKIDSKKTDRKVMQPQEKEINIKRENEKRRPENSQVKSIREPQITVFPDKEEAIKKIEEPDISILEVVNPAISQTETPIQIMVEDLIMDVYTITFSEDEDSKREQVFTIIVTPTDLNDKGEVTFTPTFAFAKTGRNICTCTSLNKIRPSYQVVLDGETFVIRGRWDEEGEFSALLYPQNVGDRKMKIQKKQIKPVKKKNVGHNIVVLDNGISIHILPLSSRNSENGYVGLLACLEDPAERTYISTCTKDKPYADFSYKGINYRVSATWENRKLVSNIQII